VKMVTISRCTAFSYRMHQDTFGVQSYPPKY